MARSASADEPPRGRFRQAWEHRRWRALVASTAVSGIGDWLYFTAFAVWLFNRTGSAGWLGGALTARLLCYVVLGPLGGAVAARYRRVRLMVVLDIGRAIAMLGLAIVVGTDGPPLLGVALAIAASMLTVPYRPALAAATPFVVPESALAAANGAEAVVGQLTVFAGPALATLILEVGSAAAAMIVNAATFILAAVLIAGTGDVGGGSAGATTDRDESGQAMGKVGVVAEMRKGWLVLTNVPGLFALNALVVTSVLAFGAEQVLHVLVAEDQLGRGAEFVGALTAAIGIGGLVIAPFAGRVAASRSPGPWLIACAVLQGGPLLLLGYITSPVLAISLLAIEGVGVIVFEVLAITLLQRLAGEHLSQVFGIQDSLSAAGQLVGAIGAPVLVAVAGVTTSCAVAGGLLVVFGVAGAPWLMRCGRAAHAKGQQTAPIVDELMTLGLFHGADRAAVEAVAAALVPERVETGTVVVEEGHPADDLFVIMQGRFSAATSAHGTLRLMAAGDWFGEIGVLEHRPRTASVVAETAGELWRIPGAAFLDAMLGMAALPDPVRLGVASRLSLTSPISGVGAAARQDRGLRDAVLAGD